MATRRQKFNFALKRFKGFGNQFRRSKRGLLGIVIIAAFSLTALFAPALSPYEPIRPQRGQGEYPAYGTQGIKIATELASPMWYKYLPWVPRGQSQLTERFYNYVTQVFGITFQTFGREGTDSATDTNLLLTHRVSSTKEALVSAKLTNETIARTLSYPDQWNYQPDRSREIMINNVYPNATIFQVIYETGVDVTENMNVVQDHMFNSPQSVNGWTNSTNYPDLVRVGYDDQDGFIFSPADTQRGCLKIAYAPTTTPQSENVVITLFKEFNYPYNEPPREFLFHTSIEVISISPVQANMTLLWIAENSSDLILIASRIVQSAPTYFSFAFPSAEPQIAVNTRSTPPQDRMFPAPGKYKLALQITLPASAGAADIYLDNIAGVLFGNSFGLMGTDRQIPFTNDIFTLLVYGSRVSLLVGVLTALFSTMIGLFLGLAAGYIGGFTDEITMRFADLLLVLPTLPLFIVLISALQRVSGAVSMWNIIIILTLFGWMSFARSVRSMVLSIRERAFIEAAKAAGAGKLHIINRHIVPNVFALVYITLATSVPGAIITEASLSWLGLGDPNLASWGKILYDFSGAGVTITNGLTDYWFWVFPACIAIALLATAFILVGYALDEILNPRLRERR